MFAGVEKWLAIPPYSGEVQRGPTCEFASGRLGSSACCSGVRPFRNPSYSPFVLAGIKYCDILGSSYPFNMDSMVALIRNSFQSDICDNRFGSTEFFGMYT